MNKPQKHTYSFPKAEKLCSKLLIEDLFVDPNVVKSFPFKLFWKKAVLPEKVKAQVVVIVPKRSINKAHKRNKIKRLCREAYRLNKHIFLDIIPDNNHSYSLALLYISPEAISFDQADKAIKKLFSQFKNDLQKNNS